MKKLGALLIVLLAMPFAGLLWSTHQVRTAFNTATVSPGMCLDDRHARFEAAGSTPQDIINQTLWRYVAQHHGYAARNNAAMWHLNNFGNMLALRLFWSVEERQALYRPILLRLKPCPTRSKAAA